MTGFVRAEGVRPMSGVRPMRAAEEKRGVPA